MTHKKCLVILSNERFKEKNVNTVSGIILKTRHDDVEYRDANGLPQRIFLTEYLYIG